MWLENRRFRRSKIFDRKNNEYIFKPHSSSYIGGLYYRVDISDREGYKLQENYCGDEGWTEEENQDLGVIPKVSGSKKADKKRELLLSSLQENIIPVRRSVITENSPDDRWARDYHYINNKDELVAEMKLPEPKATSP